MLDERFWLKVEKTESCWNWNSALNEKGYPLFTIDRKTMRAHRLVYEETFGHIPDDLTIDHLCRNRKCVNPDHLRLLTNKENVLIGEGITAQNARKTVCKNGHELVNISNKSHPTGRHCPICKLELKRKWQPQYRKLFKANKETPNG